MMMYALLPMTTQSDLGFGLIAESFLNAADNLDDKEFALGYEYLPICYLRRHSLELFLKSFIILLHKHYNLKFDDLPPSTEKPKFKDSNGKWNSLYKEHDVAKLYLYFRELIMMNRAEIEEYTRVLDWPFYKDSYLDNFTLIADYDNHSDFFRYPISKDKAKDKHKEKVEKVSFDELEKITQKRKGLFLAMQNSDDEITAIYSTGDSTTVKKIQDILKEVCYHFSCFHTAIRWTMFNGL
jgi:hypothetical protein